MKTTLFTLARTLILPLLAATALAAGAVHAMPKPFSPVDVGMLVMAPADRSIEIGDHTRYVNVTNGETVEFDVGGKHFTYAFDAWNSIGAVDLMAIAPKDVAVPQVRVYIAPNPLSVG